MATSRKRRALRPIDLVLASTRVYSSLPVVGRHLEPFAGLTAMALWGGHYAPTSVRAAVIRHTSPNAAAGQVDDAVAVDRMPPFIRARAQRREYLYRSSIRYGTHPAQLLDVWRRPDLPAGPAPVHRWPRHIEDVNAAIAWSRANIDQFGGDRGFVAVAGCSAGGDEPMTGPQRSYLHTVGQEAKADIPNDLTKAQASELIDNLQDRTGRGS